MDATTSVSGKGLQVGVVGAGVAGLSAAIALRRIGHSVEVGIFSVDNTGRKKPFTPPQSIVVLTLTLYRYLNGLSSRTRTVLP